MRPTDEVTGNLKARLGIDWQQANTLLDALMDGSSAAVDIDRLDQLIAFLTAMRESVAAHGAA